MQKTLVGKPLKILMEKLEPTPEEIELITDSILASYSKAWVRNPFEQGRQYELDTCKAQLIEHIKLNYYESDDEEESIDDEDEYLDTDDDECEELEREMPPKKAKKLVK